MCDCAFYNLLTGKEVTKAEPINQIDILKSAKNLQALYANEIGKLNLKCPAALRIFNSFRR